MRISILLILVALGLSAQVRQPMQVSARIVPAARLTAVSRASVHVAISISRATEALVWLDSENCETPKSSAQVIPQSGLYDLTFSEEEAAGSMLVCLTARDGSVRAQEQLE